MHSGGCGPGSVAQRQEVQGRVVKVWYFREGQMHSRANHILGPLSFSDRHLEWFGNDLDGAAPRRRQTLTGNHPLPKPTSLVPCRLHTPRTPVLPLNLFASCSHKHTSTHSHAHLHTQTHTHTLTHMHTRTEFTLFPRFGQETAHCSEAPFSNFVVMSAWLLREEGLRAGTGNRKGHRVTQGGGGGVAEQCGCRATVQGLG